MANGHRGDVAAVIGGRTVTLRLTLGALAELEQAFGVSDLQALGERFAAGRLSARDLIAILTAAMRGGGSEVSEADVAALPVSGSLESYARTVADVFAATFGEASDERPLAMAGAGRRRSPGRRRWLSAWGGWRWRRTRSGR